MALSCIYKSARESLSSLFCTESTGRPIFRAATSEKRCNILIRALRFDDSLTRLVREKEDPAAAISGVFNRFIKNCREIYEIGSFACVDETLIPFRGRSKFRMFMPNKPAKYGIKLMCLTDIGNFFLSKAYIYIGKNSDRMILNSEERKLKKPTQVVFRLPKRIFGTNRNITADNWFMSMELAEHLWEKSLTVERP